MNERIAQPWRDHRAAFQALVNDDLGAARILFCQALDSLASRLQDDSLRSAAQRVASKMWPAEQGDRHVVALLWQLPGWWTGYHIEGVLAALERGMRSQARMHWRVIEHAATLQGVGQDCALASLREQLVTAVVPDSEHLGDTHKVASLSEALLYSDPGNEHARAALIRSDLQVVLVHLAAEARRGRRPPPRQVSRARARKAAQRLARHARRAARVPEAGPPGYAHLTTRALLACVQYQLRRGRRTQVRVLVKLARRLQPADPEVLRLSSMMKRWRRR